MAIASDSNDESEDDKIQEKYDDSLDLIGP